MSKNDTGKYLEKATEDEFKKIPYHAFRWRRLPDSRAARGLIPSQPADYFISLAGKTAHIECKSDNSKTQRLPMFDQWPEMRAWDASGVSGFVVIHFHTVDVLQLVSITDLDTASSWSLKDYPSYETVGEIVEKILEILKR